MKEVKPIIAENMVALRKSRGLTQAELAEIFDYSDKAISRWERGDTMPDINVLCELCEFYGVTLDYLVHKGDERTEEPKVTGRSLANRIVLSALIVSIIWLAVTVIYTFAKTFMDLNWWQLFVWAVPISCFSVAKSTKAWMPKVALMCIWSGFVWTLIASIYLQIIQYNLWMMFIIGVPAQVIIVLAYNLKKTR